MARDEFRQLLREIGLVRCPRLYLDRQFLAALLAGALVVLIMRLVLPLETVARPADLWPWLFSLVLWQPFTEELLFRGVIQGQLSRFAWSRRIFTGISAANVVTSLAFTAFHFIHHPPLWAASVFVPSLVFGYFRDRDTGICTPIVLHGLYNLGYVAAIVI